MRALVVAAPAKSTGVILAHGNNAG